MTEKTGSADFWRNYRKCTGQLTWRCATPDDLPAIRRLRNVSERFLGRRQQDPALFQTPVLITLVAQNRNGRIVDIVYAEAQVEIVKMACTSLGFKEAFLLEEDLKQFLRARGFRKVIVTTSMRLKAAMSVGLEWAGFHCDDGILSHWKKRI